MSTFYNKNIYITEDELEKTYNFIKNEMDSKIEKLQKSLEETNKHLTDSNGLQEELNRY